MSRFNKITTKEHSRRWVLSTAAAIAVTSLGAFTPSVARAEDKVIAISFPNSSTVGAVIVSLDRAKEKAAELGYQVVIDDPGTDLNRQINTIKTWIQQGVPVIVAVPQQPNVFEAVAKEARDAGIKWITYGETLKNQDSTVGYSLYEDGRRLGEYAGEWVTQNLDGKANVVLLGYERATWGQLRGKGIRDGLLEKAPAATIVAEQDAITPTEGLNVTRTLLQAHPDINVILGVEDPATEGAYKAWIAAGRDKADPHAFIGGMDGTPPALRLLRDGGTVYRASMAIPLRAVGDAIIETADALMKGENPGDTIVPLLLVTEGSPDAIAQLKEQGLDK